jgi:SlyX protein
MRSPDERLTELEIKSSYADDLLEQLNSIVARQQQQIDRLQHELLALRQQLRDAPGVAAGSGHEPPPHY